MLMANIWTLPHCALLRTVMYTCHGNSGLSAPRVILGKSQPIFMVLPLLVWNAARCSCEMFWHASPIALMGIISYDTFHCCSVRQWWAGHTKLMRIYSVHGLEWHQYACTCSCMHSFVLNIYSTTNRPVTL